MSAFKGVVATADYTFDKTAKTITFSANYTGIALSDIMYITNVKSATATVIYDPSLAALGGSLSGLILTLAYDTSAMLSADPLQIIVAMGTLAAKVDLATLESTGSLSAPGDLIAATDSTKYATVRFQIYGTYTGASVTLECSNDSSTWKACLILNTVGQTWSVAALTANGQYVAPLTGRYFRARLSAISTGTISAIAEFSSVPLFSPYQTIGDIKTGMAGHGKNVDFPTAINTALMAEFDDSSPTTVSEDQFGNLRISTNRNLFTTIRDSSGSERGVAVNASSQLSVSVDNTVTVGSHAVTNAGTFAVQATPVTQADTFMLGGVNVKEINAVTPLMGSGIMGTGSLRVTIASDNDPLVVKQATAANLNATVVGTGTFVVQATLAAETTKVIGTVNVAGSQTIAVTQATASNLNMTEASAANILTKLTAGAASMVKLEDVASADADAGVAMMAIQKATPADTAGTDGDYAMLQMSAGRLWVAAKATLDAETTKVIGTVNLASGSNSIGTVGLNSGQSTSFTITTSSSTSTFNVFQAGTNYASVSIHGTYAGIQFKIQASDDATNYYDIPVFDQTANVWRAVGATLSPGDNSSTVYIVALLGGTSLERLKITASAYTSGTGSIVVSGAVANNYFGFMGAPLTLSAETTKVIGTINVASSQTIAVTNTGTFATQVAPSTSGGLTTFHLISAATTNLTVVKNGVGQLYGWYVYNNAATVRKIAFHNTTSTPSAGASIFFSIVFPPNSGANVEFSNGIPFSTGIAISTVTGIADTDTVAVALNDLTINLFYK